ncbi:MAG: GTPase Era [Gammaproteobacteria bacterium]|nr:GTPase Era [Gammaproteobacteria bacterium]
MTKAFRAGFIAILGRPNVGKSTLLNRIIGKKISITSPKPQTTRHRLLGICTTEEHQMVFVDTPGVHLGSKRYINQIMNKTAANALIGVDVTLLMITSEGWKEEDHHALKLAQQEKMNLIVLINKIDKLKNKNQLLPLIEFTSQLHEFKEIIPISSAYGTNVQSLMDVLPEYLPESPLLFPEGQTTDKGAQFIISETIREKLFRQLRDEIPYTLAVEIQQLKMTESLIRAETIIWVEKESQKGIIIGKKGEKLRTVGTHAREELESYFERKVFLQLWVKVRENWSDDAVMLRSIGYIEEE